MSLSVQLDNISVGPSSSLNETPAACTEILCIPPPQIACDSLRQTLWERGIIDETGKLLIDLPLPKLTQTEHLIDQLGVRLFKLIEEFCAAASVSRIELLGGYVLYYLANYAPDYLREAFAPIPEIAERLIESEKNLPNDIDIRFCVNDVVVQQDLRGLKDAFLELLENPELETSLIFTGISNFALIREPPYEYLIVSSLQLDYLFNSVYIPLEDPKAPLQLMSYADVPLQGWLDRALGFCRTKVISSQILFRIVSEMTKGRIPIEGGTIAKACTFKADYLKEAEKTLTHHHSSDPHEHFVYYLNLSLILDQMVFPENLIGLEPWMEFVLSKSLDFDALKSFLPVFFTLNACYEKRADHLEGKTSLQQVKIGRATLNLPLPSSPKEMWMDETFIPHLWNLSTNPIKTFAEILKDTKEKYLEAITSQILTILPNCLYQGDKPNAYYSQVLYFLVLKNSDLDVKKQLIELGNAQRWIFKGTQRDLDSWLEILSKMDKQNAFKLYQRLKSDGHFEKEELHPRLIPFLMGLKSDIDALALAAELQRLNVPKELGGVENLYQEARLQKISSLIASKRYDLALTLTLKLPQNEQTPFLCDLAKKNPLERAPFESLLAGPWDASVAEALVEQTERESTQKSARAAVITSEAPRLLPLLPSHLVLRFLCALDAAKIIPVFDDELVHEALSKCSFSKIQELQTALITLKNWNPKSSLWLMLLETSISMHAPQQAIACLDFVEDGDLLQKALTFLLEEKLYTEAFKLSDKIYSINPAKGEELGLLCLSGIETIDSYLSDIEWFKESAFFRTHVAPHCIEKIIISLVNVTPFPKEFMNLLKAHNSQLKSAQVWAELIEKAPVKFLLQLIKKLPSEFFQTLASTAIKRLSEHPALIEWLRQGPAFDESNTYLIKEASLYYISRFETQNKDKVFTKLSEGTFFQEFAGKNFSEPEVKRLPGVVHLLVSQGRDYISEVIELSAVCLSFEQPILFERVLSFLDKNRSKIGNSSLKALYFILEKAVARAETAKKIGSLPASLTGSECLKITSAKAVDPKERTRICVLKVEEVMKLPRERQEDEVMEMCRYLPAATMPVQSAIEQVFLSWLKIDSKGVLKRLLESDLCSASFSRLAHGFASNILIRKNVAATQIPTHFIDFLYSLYLDERVWAEGIGEACLREHLTLFTELTKVLFSLDGRDPLAYFEEVCEKIPKSNWDIIKNGNKLPSFFIYYLNKEDPNFLANLLISCFGQSEERGCHPAIFLNTYKQVCNKNAYFMDYLGKVALEQGTKGIPTRDSQRITDLYLMAILIALNSEALVRIVNVTFFTPESEGKDSVLFVKETLPSMPDHEFVFKSFLREEFFDRIFERIKDDQPPFRLHELCGYILYTTLCQGWYAKDPMGFLKYVERYLFASLRYLSSLESYSKPHDLFLHTIKYIGSNFITYSDVKADLYRLFVLYLSYIEKIGPEIQSLQESKEKCVDMALKFNLVTKY